MLMLLVLMAAFTVGALVWAFSGGGDRMRDRFMRYASEPVVVLDSPEKTQVRLPRYWEAFLARSGVEWTPGQTVFVLASHVILATLVATVLQLPVLGPFAGLGALYLRLRIQQGRRINKMAEQLPDALMLMASALKSGFGFQQAVQLVAREGAAPLAPEFERLGQDMALGLSIEESLVRLQTRLGSTDGEMLASALLVQRQTGGNLSEILMNLHDTIRDRQSVHGQVRTLTAQGRLSGIVLTMIPVCIALAFYVLNRDYLMALVLDPRGRIMSTVAVGLLVMGVLWIRKIVTITL